MADHRCPSCGAAVSQPDGDDDGIYDDDGEYEVDCGACGETVTFLAHVNISFEVQTYAVREPSDDHG